MLTKDTGNVDSFRSGMIENSERGHEEEDMSQTDNGAMAVAGGGSLKMMKESDGGVDNNHGGKVVGGDGGIQCNEELSALESHMLSVSRSGKAVWRSYVGIRNTCCYEIYRLDALFNGTLTVRDSDCVNSFVHIQIILVGLG